MLGIDLADRLVVMIGGGDVTARRARRFLADGARVRIVAPDLSADTATLIGEYGLEWDRRPAAPDDVREAWLVHTATGDARTDGAVATWCERSRVLCINAGDGDHGTARVAAETRAGDVIVGVVSDAGVDPGRSGAIRAAIACLLDAGALPLRRRRAAPGRVTLVGSGPGPVDLMTIRGRRALAEADVVVADRLGAVDVLAELDPEVAVIDVGKRPGDHPVPQDAINDLIVAHARAGRRVVRLKGGDPFVFGRGGEEVRACHAAGVPVEVIPGVSSAIAAPQSAGIPVTHRGVASAMHLVNGQDAPTRSTLESLRDDATTTVVLMGVSSLRGFADAALDAGAPPDRPVAIVQDGHGREQRTTRATLATVADRAEAAGVRNPAVIVIGAVARPGLLTDGLAVAAGAAV
jgi:uroporphyrin-III C-methyltransferase/precorrin-2 dehydrogenase/sirohydrochlorin ferrochelatase